MVSTLKKYRPFLLFGLLLTLTTIFLSGRGQSDDSGPVPYDWASGDPLLLWRASSYPSDPTDDIPWSCGLSGREDIACAFNNARAVENTQLGTTLPVMTLPIQTKWDDMEEAEKALWLINQERSDRGIDPLEQIEANVTTVAQTYADYLLDNDAWGHYEDGRSPWERLEENPTIDACHDSLSVAENLAVFVSTGNIPLPVERSVYMWMYDDAGSSWGHRHAILWYPYTENSGLPGVEGFLGIGRASGGPYQGPFDTEWPSAEMIVMNVFDPCSAWEYTSTTTSFPSSSTTTPATTTSTSGCSIGIEPSSEHVLSLQSLSFTVLSHGSCNATDHTWSLETTIGSSCDQQGNYTAGINSDMLNPVTDTILVVDQANDGITAVASVTVFSGCPSQYLYGELSEEVLLLRWFRDTVLSRSPEGRQIIQLYYQWSPLLLKAIDDDKKLQGEVKEVVNHLLDLIRGSMQEIMPLDAGR